MTIENRQAEGFDLPRVDGLPRETRHEWASELAALDDGFVEAALMVADALHPLSARFLAGDEGSILQSRSLASDVTGRCRKVEDQGFVLLARAAPVAGELRRLVSLLRLVTDVHRAANLLKHVCETLQRFDPRLLPGEVRTHLEELAMRSSEVFRLGITAWRRRDALALTEVDAADDAVDRLQDSLLETVVSQDGRGDDMLALGLIARYYERIADHGVALAIDATFAVTGERIDKRLPRSAANWG